MVVFDAALRRVLGHREGLAHQREPADGLHDQLLQVVVRDLLQGEERRMEIRQLLLSDLVR